MTKPIAVLISDIHFTVPTLDLAAQSLLKAQFQAKMLNVPLIIAGDTLDSKAIIRAECANKLLRMLSVKDKTPTYILVGNHDLLNEKDSEHALNFLVGFCKIIDKPTQINQHGTSLLLVPYTTNVENLKLILNDNEPLTPNTLIMHTGIQTAYMGHYQQDKTSLPPEAFDGLRVVSGHYHRRQDIKCGKTGLFSYIGNPYTLTFGEANDGPKGFQILNSDGSLTFVPTNLRKHMIVERTAETLMEPIQNYNPGDLVWIKVSGTRGELEYIKKEEVGNNLFGHNNFKFDKIYSEELKSAEVYTAVSDNDILDALIDSSNESVDEKTKLKSLWRELINETAKS